MISENNISKTRFNKNPAIIVIILSILALLDWPYGYYTFLKLIITTVAIYYIYYFYENKLTETLNSWFWGLIFIALLFNPIFPVYLIREIWASINILTAIFFIIIVFKVLRDGKNIKILIFEDDPDISEFYGTKFKENGIDVKSYLYFPNNLADEVAKEKPDIISMGIILPFMDGYEATKILKNDQRTKYIPIVGLDNLSSEKDINKAISEGMKEYFIMADCSPEEYVKNIEKIILS